MKKLLATTAVALIASAGAASAQSVLERVLGQIDNATNLASVNGTFANIAENIGGAGVTTIYVDNTGNVISEAEFAVLAATPFQGQFTAVPATNYVNAATGEVLTPAQYDALSAGDKASFVVAGETNFYTGPDGAFITAAEFAALSATDPTGTFSPETIAVAGLAGIDGSIRNVVVGITEATQTATAGVAANAVEFNMPTLNFGAMATTALGAVNTGDITLGVNSRVDEAATSSTRAVAAVMDQLGGSADTGAIVLNIASNMTGINGSISNSMTTVNGTIGALSTTALGAVNTGTIVSGVNAAVQGIVGTSGQGDAPTPAPAPAPAPAG